LVSSDAFTRAFREQFGLTPDELRSRRDLSSLTLVEPLSMHDISPAALAEPRFATDKSRLFAGFGGHFSVDNTVGIPLLWQKIVPHIGHIPGQIGHVAYGVSHNCDDQGAFDYLAGVEVSSFSDLPEEFERLRVPEQYYAVFEHRGHITGIKQTFEAIWRDWLPKSGHEPVLGPTLERMDERFDGATGNGVVEIWLAIKG